MVDAHRQLLEFLAIWSYDSYLNFRFVQQMVDEYILCWNNILDFRLRKSNDCSNLNRPIQAMCKLIRSMLEIAEELGLLHKWNPFLGRPSRYHKNKQNILSYLSNLGEKVQDSQCLAASHGPAIKVSGSRCPDPWTWSKCFCCCLLGLKK